MSKDFEINCWCALNRGEIPDADNISFQKTEAEARKYWKGQAVRKCRIVVEKEGEER